MKTYESPMFFNKSIDYTWQHLMVSCEIKPPLGSNVNEKRTVGIALYVGWIAKPTIYDCLRSLPA